MERLTLSHCRHLIRLVTPSFLYSDKRGLRGRRLIRMRLTCQTTDDARFVEYRCSTVLGDADIPP